MVAQFVRQQQGGNRFGQAGDMLGHIDQRHREVARGVQYRKPQRADQHDVAGGGAPVLPEHDNPGQQRDRQDDGDRRMGEPQFFQIAQAASARRQFPVDGRVKPAVLEAEAAKRAHQRHVADDIDHLAVDGRGLVREFVVQRLARGGQVKHRDHHGAGDNNQARRHRQADGSDQGNCRDRRDARRQHVPDEHVFDRENRIRSRGNAAGQHSRQPVGKIARRVTGQVTENVAAQIAGHAHEGEARGPAGDPPQEIIRGDQRHEKNECQPYAAGAGRPGRQTVDQIFHAVLRAHRTGDGCNDGGQNDHMRGKTLAKVAQHKWKGPVRVS